MKSPPQGLRHGKEKMSDSTAMPAWERQLLDRLPVFGHRNWIVVADSAYPAQSRPGIETIVSGAGQLEVARKVADVILAAKHVRANIYLDRELAFVHENDAPGVTEYRGQLLDAAWIHSLKELPHEQIIAKLDKAAQLFRILIVKTEMTIPYSSIFFELDCGYWKPEAERQIRQAMLVTEFTETGPR
jgi:hypothetical protein